MSSLRARSGGRPAGSDRDRSRRDRSTRRLAWVATLGLLAVAANRATGAVHSRWLVGAQAVTRWALLPAHLVVPVAILRRWPGVAALAAGLAGYQLWLSRATRGRARPEPAPAGSTSIRLVSANLLLFNPSVGTSARALSAEPSDVLVLQELTPDHLATLQAAGLFEQLPHALVNAEPGFHGAGLFSRWPLADPELVDLDGVALPVATIATPDGPMRVAVVHAKNPGAAGELRRWQHQLAELGRLAARSPIPTMLVGDFNATADHRDFRKLLATGLRDAYDVVGRGSGASWPVWPNLVPPLMRIDHALVSDGFALGSAVVRDSPGSDHRHLQVELRLAGPGRPAEGAST